ncbi:MAG: rRNA synthase [Pseudomonadota bacterium]|nr:rRNA synthase [Pseudomonadota bacterium]
MSAERLQKVLSQAGFGSRREIERWIEQGLLHINGKKAILGDVVKPDDKISLRGRVIDNPMRLVSRTRILLYNKPLGEISSRHDPFHPRTVFDKLPKLSHGRWVQVGRLDINTGGLLVFTNNGELANRLMHPKYEYQREYAVRVFGQVTPEMLKALKAGVELDDGMAKFNDISVSGGDNSNAWYHVTLSEGRHRVVRRLWQSQGVEVSRLIRIKYGPIQLPRWLNRGQFVEMTPQDVDALIADL